MSDEEVMMRNYWKMITDKKYSKTYFEYPEIFNNIQEYDRYYLIMQCNSTDIPRVYRISVQGRRY